MRWGRSVSIVSSVASAGLLLYAPLHAVAYIRDEDVEGLIRWAGAAFDALP